MIKVNLVPAGVLVRQQKRRYATQAACAGIIVLLIFAGVSFSHWNKARRLNAELEKANGRLKKLEVIVKKVKKLEADTRTYKARINLIRGLVEGKYFYSFFLQAFIKLIPEGIWLTDIGTKGGGKGKLKVNVRAGSMSHEDIAEWLRRLEKSGDFSESDLGSIQTVGAKEARSYTFSLKCAYAFKVPEWAKEK